MGGFAWVTLATNDSYSLGALVLAHSLKQAGTVHQLAVLVTPGVTNAMRDKLASVFNIVQEVNILDSRDETNLRLLKRPELGITFTKLHCWRLTQYEKCVFLDADTLVLQNCDELFEREELSAAPDVGWPDCFNSGVFVYRPSLDTYEKLIQFALDKGSFDGGDQGLLNLYFSDWAHKDISKHLPFIYNMCSTASYSYLPAFKQFGANAKIVHFIGTAKPWLQYFNTETRKVQPSGDSSHLQEVLQRWWDIFCSLIHPHLSPAMAGLAGAFAQLTLGVPRTEEQDALENLLRKQAWEVGNIDYLGRDSFENIWSKITETLSAAPAVVSAQLAVAPVEPVVALAPEPQLPAPAESQSQSAPPQEETIPVQPPVTPIDTPSDILTSTDTSKLDSTESIPTVEATETPSTPTPKEVEPVATSPAVEKEVESPAVEKEVEPPAAVGSNEVVEAPSSESPADAELESPSTPKEVEPVVEPVVRPQNQEVAKEVETKVPEPEPEVPETPKEIELPAEPVASPLPQKKEADKEVEVQIPEVSQISEEPVVEPVCPRPRRKEPASKVAPASSPSTQQETPIALKPQDEVASLKIPQEEEPEVQESPKPVLEAVSATAKEPIATPQPAPPPTAAPKKLAASSQPSESSKPTVSSSIAAPKATASAPTPKAVTKPSLKDASKASEPPKAAPLASKPAASGPKLAASSVPPKESPKTKVTEPTPPATPSSPPIEKAKQALAAEASIPDTPPPTEGGSNPTPPPRKTDKPKKVAAKPKK